MSRVEVVEQVIMIVAIAALWPWVFGYREPWYQWGLLSAIALAMVAILARKLRRMNEAFDDARKTLADQEPPPAPFPTTRLGPDGQPKGRNGRG